MNHLEDAMQQFYQQSSLDKGQSGGKGDSSEKEEMVLNVFDGICYLCQKKGHKAHFCLECFMGVAQNLVSIRRMQSWAILEKMPHRRLLDILGGI